MQRSCNDGHITASILYCGRGSATNLLLVKADFALCGTAMIHEIWLASRFTTARKTCLTDDDYIHMSFDFGFLI